MSGSGHKFGDDRQRVKDASDIVRVIGEHLTLKPKGREYVCVCPFHDDHKPSMAVVPAKQIFHCFPCGAGGDVFTFIQKYLKMEFREALEYLAERANITLTRWQPGGNSDQPAGPTRSDIVKACATAADFFRTILRGDHGAAARAVIQKRGISPEMVEQFGLGASPDRWDGLLLTLKSKNLELASFIEAGLFKKRDDGGFYDAFRNRLMFPILDAAGRVVAFGARKIRDEDEPKYLNSPETRLFNKSATLYGLPHASKAIQTTRTALITEGYTDTIACHQAGVTNAVATLGTALTRQHAQVLSRLCERVVLLFDGDEAGQRAADRAVEIFFAESLDVRICTLNKFTDAKDPDELLKREGGVEVLDRAIAASTDLLEYRFARVRSKLGNAGPSALAKAVDEELTRLRELGLDDVEPVKRRLVVKQLAGLAGVGEQDVLAKVGKGSPAKPRISGDETETGAELARLSHGQLSDEEWLLGCILSDPRFLSSLMSEERELLAAAAYRSALVTAVAHTIAESSHAGEAPALAAVLARLSDPDTSAAATCLSGQVQTRTDGDAARLSGTWNDCLSRWRKRAVSPPGARGIDELIELKRKEHAGGGGDRRVLPGFKRGSV